MIDPLVYSNLVFWKGLKKSFLNFLLTSLLLAGRSVHSAVLIVAKNCSLRIVKKLSTFDNNFATESVLEKCIQTPHAMVVESESTQIL